MIGSWRCSVCRMRNWRSGSRKLLDCPHPHRQAGAEGSSSRGRHPPSYPTLSFTSTNGHLRAEWPRPRGVRPGDLVAALGAPRCPDGPVERINGSNAMTPGSSRSL